MRIDLSLYPKLNNKQFENAKISLSEIEYTYTYSTKSDKDRIVPIEVIDEGEKTVEIFDETGKWDILFNDFQISQEILIENPKTLFGDYGVVIDEAIIGVGVLWYSKDSRQRGAQRICSFDKFTNHIDSQINLNFELGQLRNTLFYEVVLYVEDTDSSTNTHFANETGMILGSIYAKEIILEGRSSSFPVVTVESDEGFLWSLYCNWAELEDDFMDSITLRLNVNHRDYDLLNFESKKFNEALYKQILVSVVSQIIETAHRQGEIPLIEEQDNFPEGSVGGLIKYYLDVYQVNYSSISEIYKSIMEGVW